MEMAYWRYKWELGSGGALEGEERGTRGRVWVGVTGTSIVEEADVNAECCSCSRIRVYEKVPTVEAAFDLHHGGSREGSTIGPWLSCILKTG